MLQAAMAVVNARFLVDNIQNFELVLFIHEKYQLFGFYEKMSAKKMLVDCKMVTIQHLYPDFLFWNAQDIMALFLFDGALHPPKLNLICYLVQKMCKQV